MNIHLFGKFDSPCCCIWALNKTASDNIVKIVSCAEEAITDNFYTSSIFDPLGVLAAIILEPKLIIQSLWEQKIDWDS